MWSLTLELCKQLRLQTECLFSMDKVKFCILYWIIFMFNLHLLLLWKSRELIA